jgi:arginase family enzyme
MDYSDYFDPVSLERPEFEFLDNQESFSHHITVHTPDRPIRNLDKYQVAIIGVPEDRNAFIQGAATAPNAIRERLYQLAKIKRDLQIYDLGNLKNGGSVNDSYFALRDIFLELWERKIRVLLLGGSQDLSKGAFLAMEKDPDFHHVLSIDSMLDFSNGGETYHSRNYLDHLLTPENRERFTFTNLGHQVYFTSPAQLEELEKLHLESIRLGTARQDLRLAEPLIRDARFISVDLGSVRHADAPGTSIPSPNGFTGDELCQFARYAGLSGKVEGIGFFELQPARDIHHQSAHLTAQAVWYYLDGLAHMTPEHPIDTPEHMTQFIVNLDLAGHDITFHKSSLSDRWWVEIPAKNPASGYNFFVSCSYEDYLLASKQEIPERWWRYLHRLGNESK